ncbi:hypothetical protein [Nocardia sp. NBC_01327]|uniref:hypothetical protein n=1 Tax=Nocardia sp. NBC_01327 TaxID=2903593 RepID=UPI002E0F563A|nr:class A beta-lactamase-related serine hydrolase [Nocardia sp. NBC_01327]
MSQNKSRSPQVRWLWIAIGVIIAAVTVALSTAPSALATVHPPIATTQQPATAPPVTTAAPVAAAPGLPGPSPQAIALQVQSAIQAASPGTTVGIDVVDTQTGAVLADLNADQQFYTASVVKVLIALDAMQSQGWQPDSGTTAQLQQMLATSDDDIADSLWDADGGDAIVTRMANLVGMPGTQAPEDSSEWGETLTTPQDVVTLYQWLTTQAPPSASNLILTALRGTTQISADGTDQYFGIPDGLNGDDWAVKQGWMSLDSSTTLDTTGLVGLGPLQPLRYAVVVLTSQPADISWSAAGAALTDGVAQLRPLIP